MVTTSRQGVVTTSGTLKSSLPVCSNSCEAVENSPVVGRCEAVENSLVVARCEVVENSLDVGRCEVVEISLVVGRCEGTLTTVSPVVETSTNSGK